MLVLILYFILSLLYQKQNIMKKDFKFEVIFQDHTGTTKTEVIPANSEIEAMQICCEENDLTSIISCEYFDETETEFEMTPSFLMFA